MANIQSFQWSAVMYAVGDTVQIINHSEPACNGHYGEITHIQVAYDGYTHYYTVKIPETMGVCTCTDDEIMEG